PSASYPLSLHDALPISVLGTGVVALALAAVVHREHVEGHPFGVDQDLAERAVGQVHALPHLLTARPGGGRRARPGGRRPGRAGGDRKSTRLNSSHVKIS